MSKEKPDLLSILGSPIGKKILTGITGLGLAFFVLVHMVGNLSFFSSDPNAYNVYSHTLIGLGPLLWVVELGLLAFFVIHAVIGVNIARRKRKARPEGYAKYQTAGGPSRQTLSSRTMIVTGLILFIFVIIHVKSFKFGPDVDAGYVVTVGGEQIRDLKRLLIERFQSPIYTFGYVAVMLLLGFHLRHGIWSAMQSLGATNPRMTPLIYMVGGVLGVLIAIGFVVLPLWIFFSGGV